ncbi:MAG: cytochrome c biosis protein CcmG, thiol:disulfide interchange protein DsbE [Solirubrobacterales bacterium]|nr:cytochrome c biosis protein CcmG, thiol:disulfide interchange protein DsbE [Solirubrobacterales bacterium]
MTAVAVVAVLGVGCGGGEPDTVDPGSANPDSALTPEEAAAPAKKAPPELVAIRDEANEILDEGTEGYEARIAELEGTPVVVNNWASWCGPCREEIPYFQKQAIERGDEVAFLGLLSGDGPDTGATFMDEFPMPYPSFLDSDSEIAEDLNLRGLPNTVFYDSSGEIVFTKYGPYTDLDTASAEEQLAADIEEYAQ